MPAKLKKTAMHTTGSIDSMHLFKQVTRDTLSLHDSTKSKDSLQLADTATLVENNAIKTDSVVHKNIFAKDSTTTKDSSTNRYFEAYYHVRIFSDSLQSVCDSLFYSAEDSAFRLYKNPVVWSQESQIVGDTIYLYTQNEKPKRLYAFENGFIIQKVAPEFFNQVKGRTVNAYFKEGNIDYVRAKGNSESIYYAQDDSSKFVEANKATADIIDMYFENKKPQRVIFRVNLIGTSFPMRQLPDDMKLRGFNWHDAIRPKTKEELFYKNIIPKIISQPFILPKFFLFFKLKNMLL